MPNTNPTKTVLSQALRGACFTAALTDAAIDEDNRSKIQLMPYGEFRATDGRPTDVVHWIIADDNGKHVVELTNSYRNKVVIDYEHQTLNALKNGNPAPAAGWIEYVYLTPRGVYANVEWTDKAAAMIKSGEYKYISPVFAYDKDGYVRKLFNAALTNNPALDGMDEVVAASITQLSNQNQLENQKPEETMDKKLLLAVLGLAETATDDDINASLTALSKHKALADDKSGMLAICDHAVALSAQVKDGNDGNNPDPAKYVEIAVVEEMKSQIAALTANQNAKEAESLITAALSSGKLLPAQKPWAEKLAKENLTALSEYIESAQPVAALTGSQASQVPEGNQTAALTAAQKAACRCLGMSESEFKENLKEDK